MSHNFPVRGAEAPIRKFPTQIARGSRSRSTVGRSANGARLVVQAAVKFYEDHPDAP